jgi:hypothetical protein
MKENIDYQLIPTPQELGEGWDVRFVTGAYPETVIRYGVVRIDGENKQLNFDYKIIYSPDPDVEENDSKLEECATEALRDIILSGVEQGYVSFKDVETQ